MLPIRTILHATDFSDSSDLAFRLACSLARDYDARLLVLHIARHPAIILVEALAPPEPELYREELTDMLHKLHMENSSLHLEPQLLFGSDPAAKIVQVAQESKADLIVLGTHGRTGLRRLLMGSVAEQVVRQAPCPVLTVKAPAAGNPEKIAALEEVESTVG